MQTIRLSVASLLPLLWAAAGPTSLLRAQDEGAAANRGCYECHAEEGEVMEFPDGEEVSITVAKRGFLESAHGRLECTACHVGLDPMEHLFEDRDAYPAYQAKLAARCTACHDGTATDVAPEDLPSKTIHGTLHPVTGEDAPLCTDCHSSHTVPRGEKLRAAASQACADCHEETYATYAASVHGAGVIDADNTDLPGCVDCHAGHEEPGSGMAAKNVRLGKPCMTCHSDKDLMGEYGLSTAVVSTYLNDFHGVSVRFHDEAGESDGMPMLVCADCHGVHDIAAMSASNPLLMKENLQKVCQQCHTDASESFPDAWLSHYEPSLTKAPLVYAVKLGYWVFIPFVILGLGLQIFAHLVLFPRRRRKDKGGGDHHGTADGPLPVIEAGDERRMVTRFGRSHRLQHLLVMTTFVLLLLTGLPQKFWDHGWASWLTSLFGGIDTMRTVHRVTGILFTFLCVLHAAIAIFGVLTRRTGMTIVPDKKDFRDAIVNLKYYVGAADAPPKFDRYDYRQKFEYWGMIVGSLVMVLSGFVLYFPMLFADYLPGQLIPAAKMAHTYEAMMAMLTIVIWHMYGAHLNPDCFPLDRSIFSGKVSLARMKHEHPLEFERVQPEITQLDEAVPSVDSPSGDVSSPGPSTA